MKLDYAQINDVTGELTVGVEESDYAEKVQKKLKEIGKTHPLPGFRPGHAPASLLKKKFGDAAKYEVINEMVGNTVYDYIKENNLQVLGNPVPAKENVIKPEENEFTLKFQMALAPKINFTADKNLHVPYYNIQVTDEMVDRQDQALRRRFGKQEPGDTVDETALVKGVITELDENGEPLQDGVVVENGIVAPQYFKSEEQRNLFLGKHVGDVIRFNPAETCESNPTELSSMLGLPKEEAEEHKGDFNFEVKEIIVLTPAQLGEEYYKDVFGDNVKDEAEYREAVKKMIEASFRGDQNYRFTIDAEKAISEAVGEVQLADDVLKSFLLNRNENMTEEALEAEYPQIRSQLVWDLEKELVANQLGIKVEQEDMLNTARMMARNQFQQYGMTNVPDDAIDHYANEILKDEKASGQIYRQTADMKFFAALRDAVSLDEKQVTVDEFNALFAKPEAEK